MTGPTQSDIRNLARFRYALRRFLYFSEQVARRAGLTPQQHQLLLGVAAFTDKGSATIGEIAEFLQVRHHSAVGLIDRAVKAGLVRREVNPDDQREVFVTLTADGSRKLRMLTELHHKELSGLRRSLDIFRLEKDNALIAKTSQRRAKAPRSARS
ncbi:MAG TPA: MarR family transcriptional regulator [Candidatus Margulisiibacteriota bacterium]|nr:MarR family transcriptional regulator [Candidatus Margulisiibacteriota bacterium]